MFISEIFKQCFMKCLFPRYSNSRCFMKCLFPRYSNSRYFMKCLFPRYSNSGCFMKCLFPRYSNSGCFMKCLFPRYSNSGCFMKCLFPRYSNSIDIPYILWNVPSFFSLQCWGHVIPSDRQAAAAGWTWRNGGAWCPWWPPEAVDEVTWVYRVYESM